VAKKLPRQVLGKRIRFALLRTLGSVAFTRKNSASRVYLVMDNPKRTEFQELVSSRPYVLIILFAVTGVLGLPLLFMSPAFSRSGKVFWAIVVTVYTALLIWVTVVICLWAYHEISDVMS
jgi:heme/copper-type cytochrome/quinol oxidase subunit 4